MCGINAVLRGPKEDASKLRGLCEYMKQACIVGTVRGSDSTGMFQVDKSNTVEVCKYPYSGELFVEKRRPSKMFNMADNNLITVLHHRSATIGNINQDNCHPFEHEGEGKYLVGVHNGHISNHKRKEDDYDFPVDSDWGLYQIMKHGPEKGVGLLEGAMVLAWWENDGLFRLFGNNKRPIYWAYVKDRNAMVVSSEAGMLWWLCNRNGISLESKPLFPDENTIYTFDPENLRDFKVSKVILPEKIPYHHIVQGTDLDWEGRRRAIQSQHGSGGNHSNVVAMFPRQRDVDAVVNGKTWQTHKVFCEPKDVRENYKIELGTVVEFVPDEHLRGMCSQVNAMVGEALIKDSDGVIDTPMAIMDAATSTVKINVWKVAKALGEIKCRVIGISKVTINAKDHNCLLLSKPISVSGNNLEAIDIEDVAADMIKGPNGLFIPKQEFVEMCKPGCSWCTDDIGIADAESLTWYPDSKGGYDPVCKDCQQKMDEAEAAAIKKQLEQHPPEGAH